MRLLPLLALLAVPVAAQPRLSGSISSDVLLPQSDSEIGTEHYSEWALTNTYADLQLQSTYVDAGLRLEYLEHPLPGFERDFAGWGVPYGYVKGRLGHHVELTLGTFYEQFGSGFILRTYEERSLGIDGSLLGGRVVVKPLRGLTLKALGGRQRCYWEWNDALITGADAEASLDEWMPCLSRRDMMLTLGGSWVCKYEDEDVIMPDATHRLVMPEYVHAFDVRARWQHGGWNVLTEYAQKSQDPSFDNDYIYRRGYVAMLSASWSKRGVSALVQAKRSDNMTFRSRRSMSGTSSFINHLPAFTQEHTYALTALYPYATNAGGEWAYQAELAYTFRRQTPLGGRYGTKAKLNFSHVHAIDRHPRPPLYGKAWGTDGYGSAFWRWGDQTYYQDLNVQVEKKLSRTFRLNLMYMNQLYNQTVIEGEGGMVHADIVVAEAKWQPSRQTTLRGELQYLATADDAGDWAFALAEVSLQPHWMLTLSDQYNCSSTHVHYYQGAVTFNTGAHRLQAGYGRTRAGYNCSGGVCRYVPASRGFTLAYNYNF